jgi:predicted metalloprotease with PDZ domain
MKIVSLFIPLSFCWLLCMPVLAVPEQSLVSDGAKLAFSESANGNNITQTRINLKTKTSQVQANHGQQLIGRVGLQIDEESGIIRQIYAHSHLREYGIQEGDRLIALNGNQIDGIGFTNSYLGRPGDFVNLTFERKGLYKTVRVQLVDAAILKYDNIDFQRWASQEKTW